MISVCERVENIVGKGENAGHQHFLLFPLCFQKFCLSRSLKVGNLWERFTLCQKGKFETEKMWVICGKIGPSLGIFINCVIIDILMIIDTCTDGTSLSRQLRCQFVSNTDSCYFLHHFLPQCFVNFCSCLFIKEISTGKKKLMTIFVRSLS